ncbi:hypothetical protein K435DRAFT_854547 [Dendrothele bispora CBS 962.96]|uniref:Uncharacterized protein n=1 Tax=Dendrothele bispora (strain CBS 962.96) TaxID=1314807 RepID=A0A4S8MDI8_DENBC|nr:hypothetical protein K435DRAFT_854547 [Dendrothele bispora CBS 962.96]
MSEVNKTVKFCVIENVVDTRLRDVHREFAGIADCNVEVVSKLPTEVATATTALRNGDVDGIIISRSLVGRIILDGLTFDDASSVINGYNFIKFTDNTLCAVNTDVVGVHYAMTFTCAYPEFRSALSCVFYVVECSNEAFEDLRQTLKGLNDTISLVRYTDLTSAPDVSCVITDTPKRSQSDDATDQITSLLSVTFHTHRSYFGINQKNIFLNLGCSESGPDLTPWSFLALRSGWEEISSDLVEKFQTQLLWQQVTLCDNNLFFHEDSWVHSVICVVVDLSDNWSVRSSIPFARTYKHAFTIDDLLLDEWLCPPSDSLIRRGTSLRRFFCTRWSPGRNAPTLPHPYTFLFENTALSLRTGVIVVVKHAGFGTYSSELENCLEVDSRIVERLVMNYRAYKLEASNSIKRFSYLLGDRRFATGTRGNLGDGSKAAIRPATSCLCGFCIVPSEIFHLIFDPSDMATLAVFSTTCRSHYRRIVHLMDYRVNKVIRKLTIPGLVDAVDIKTALRDTGGIIHGLAALLPLLPDDIETPNNIFIATPVATRKTWIDLFARVPHLPNYHLWDNNVYIGTLQLVRVRSVFFLPNKVVLTLQESFFNSAMPILLSHPTTAMCCGISYGAVFTLYPHHVKNRITDRIFERHHPPQWYLKTLMKPLQFTCFPASDYDNHTFARPEYTMRDCALVWRRTSGCHDMGSLPWSPFNPIERPGIPWGGDWLWRRSIVCNVPGCRHWDAKSYF